MKPGARRLTFPAMREVGVSELVSGQVLVGWWDGVCGCWHVTHRGNQVGGVAPIEGTRDAFEVNAGLDRHVFDTASRLLVQA